MDEPAAGVPSPKARPPSPTLWTAGSAPTVVLQGQQRPDASSCDATSDRVWILDSRTSLRCGADSSPTPIIARTRRADSGSNSSSSQAISSDSSFLGAGPSFTSISGGRSSRSSSMSSLRPPTTEEKRAESPLPSGLLHRVSFASLPAERRCDSPARFTPNIMGVAARASALLAHRAAQQAAQVGDAPKPPRRAPRPRYEPPPFEQVHRALRPFVEALRGLQLYRYDSEDGADDEETQESGDGSDEGAALRIRRSKPPRPTSRSRGRPRGRLAPHPTGGRRPPSPDRIRHPLERIDRSESRGRARKSRSGIDASSGTVVECLSDGFDLMDLDDDTPRASASPSADESWVDETTSSASSSLSSSPL